MYKLLLAGCLIFHAITVHAEWEKLESNLKKGEIHYFDPDTVHREDHYRKAWLLSSYVGKRTGGYHSVKTYYEFDCQQNIARSQTMLLYPDAKAKGEVIGAQHEESQEWFDFSATSIFGQVAARICLE